MAGTLGFPYRLFAPAVAVSTGIWAGTFLFLGARFGPAAARILGRYPWIYVAGTAVVIGLLTVFLVRLVMASRRGPS